MPAAVPWRSHKDELKEKKKKKEHCVSSFLDQFVELDIAAVGLTLSC